MEYRLSDAYWENNDDVIISTIRENENYAKNGQYEKLLENCSKSRYQASMVNYCWSSCASPLYIAADKNDTALANSLLQYCKKNNIQLEIDNVYYMYHRSPLQAAAMNGNIEMVEWLVAHGADVNMKVRYSILETPLHFAIRQGHINVVEYLLQHGANMRAKSYYYETPLHYAVANQKIEAMKLVLAGLHSQDLNELTLQGKTALHLAAKHNFLEGAKLLLENGADPDLQTFSATKAIEDASSDEMRNLIQSYINKKTTQIKLPFFANKTDLIKLGNGQVNLERAINQLELINDKYRCN